jgi:opacity protein-like surface antigen
VTVRAPVRALCVAATLAAACFATSALRAEPSALAPEVGWDYGDVLSARSTALSGALRVLGNPTEGLFQNPANMASQRVYHLGALAAIWPEAQRQSYGASAVDSIVSSSRLAGGLGGVLTFQDPNGIERTAKDARFALAFPFGDKFFVGAAGRYLVLNQDGRGPLGDSAASGGLRDSAIAKTLSFDAGMTLRPTELFALSLVGTNLTNPGLTFAPTTFGGGAGVGSRTFSVEIDGIADFTTWGRTTARVMGGGELLVADRVPLRLGYRWDQGASSHALSGGIGYNDPAFSAEIGVRRTVSGDAATAVVIGFKYHLESTGLTPSPTDDF